jgi:hypothetical protein
VGKSKWTTAEPFDSLFERLLLKRYSFVHALDFVFQGLGWSNPSQWDCEVYFGVPTTLFGVGAGKRPGDIDALIIPCVGSERLFDQATAIEAKSFRVRRAKRGKSPSDYGSAQARGLVEIGFPYVGLFHLALMEQGGCEEHDLLPVWPTNTPMAPNAEPQEWINLDLSSSNFASRHNPRLIGLNVPDFVGLKLFSTTEMPDGGLWGHTVGFERPVAPNPEMSNLVVDQMRSNLHQYPSFRVGFTQPRFRVRDNEKRRLDSGVLVRS